MSTSSSTHISEPSLPASQDPVIQLEGVRLSLPGNSGDVDILNGIDLAINARQTVAVLGPSGAGKTSLLMVMAGLEQISGGSISLSGKPITHMDEDMLAQLRRDEVGIVFQAFRLIPSMTALQNVAVPLELARVPDALAIAQTALEQLGLGHRLDHLPEQLSGGEQQRVAIARAIAPSPRILLADEPTGNLDSATGEIVITELFAAAETVGAALVLVTHDEQLALRCSRIIRIEDGAVISDQQQR
ncbi:MAG: ABC transporter ATP-binding protein [Candidatus Puniceispirillaceae bacterium]